MAQMKRSVLQLKWQMWRSVVENTVCGCRHYQGVLADACFQSLRDQSQLPLASGVIDSWVLNSPNLSHVASVAKEGRPCFLRSSLVRTDAIFSLLFFWGFIVSSSSLLCSLLLSPGCTVSAIGRVSKGAGSGGLSQPHHLCASLHLSVAPWKQG